MERGKNIRLQIERPQYRPNVLFDLLKEKGNAFWQKMLEREKIAAFQKQEEKLESQKKLVQERKFQEDLKQESPTPPMNYQRETREQESKDSLTEESRKS